MPQAWNISLTTRLLMDMVDPWLRAHAGAGPGHLVVTPAAFMAPGFAQGLQALAQHGLAEEVPGTPNSIKLVGNSGIPLNDGLDLV